MSATRTADSGAQLALSAVSAMDPEPADVVAVSWRRSQPPQQRDDASRSSSATSSRRLRADTDEGSSSCAAPDATAAAS